jgi:hypothetical protein
MFFNQAFQAPVVIEIDGERISIPKFTIDDFTAWGAELDVAREKKLTAGMDLDRRFHFLAFYNVLPMELGDLRRLARSPAGIKRIVAVCIARATITARKGQPVNPPEPLPVGWQKKIQSAHHQDLQRLAELLADVDDQAEKIQQANSTEGAADSFAGEGDGGAGQSPLTSPATAESNA